MKTCLNCGRYGEDLKLSKNLCSTCYQRERLKNPETRRKDNERQRKWQRENKERMKKYAKKKTERQLQEAMKKAGFSREMQKAYREGGYRTI